MNIIIGCNNDWVTQKIHCKHVVRFFGSHLSIRLNILVLTFHVFNLTSFEHFSKFAVKKSLKVATFPDISTMNACDSRYQFVSLYMYQNGMPCRPEKLRVRRNEIEKFIKNEGKSYFFHAKA